MNLDQLCILQIDKSVAAIQSSGTALLTHLRDADFAKRLDSWVRVESCLRTMWIYPAWIESQLGLHTLLQASLFEGGVDGLMTEQHRANGNSGFRYFRGIQAYSHLLRVACGLESKVLGETDIFGQVKAAWVQALERAGSSTHLECLGPWIQRSFEDVKEVRTRYLQNLGGVSYGSLVRKVVQASPFERGENAYDSVLVVGAGQIASSVAPYLWDRPLKIWNRSPEGLVRMEKELRSLASRFANGSGTGVPFSRVGSSGKASTGQKTSGVALDLSFSSDPDVELRWWKECRDVVVAIPFDQSRDSTRIQMRMGASTANPANAGKVIHLGGLVSGLGNHGQEWGRVPGFVSLDQVFEISQQQTELRSFQVEQAARACDERAKLSSIGNSICIPHGWEDLALFA